MTKTSLVDLDRAVIEVSGSSIMVDDPDSALLVKVEIDQQRRISQLKVAVRHPSGRITGRALARLPIAHIQRLAVVAMTKSPSPDEIWWTTAARRKPSGGSWDQRHWETVLSVATWAKQTGRPGGGPQAVADLWGVTKNPTAYRWIKMARSRRATCA